MTEEYESSMSDVKRVFTKINRQMAENLDEVT